MVPQFLIIKSHDKIHEFYSCTAANKYDDRAEGTATAGVLRVILHCTYHESPAGQRYRSRKAPRDRQSSLYGSRPVTGVSRRRKQCRELLSGSPARPTVIYMLLPLH